MGGGGFNALEERSLSTAGQGNFYNINKYLRDINQGKIDLKKAHGKAGAEVIKATEKHIKNIDSAIEKSRMKKDTNLYRGVSDRAFLDKLVEGKSPGDTIQFSTYSHTSRSEKWARDFIGKEGKGGMIEIMAPAGSNGLDMEKYSRFGDEEQEIVLHRNAKYIYEGIDPKTKAIKLKLQKE